MSKRFGDIELNLLQSRIRIALSSVRTDYPFPSNGLCMLTDLAEAVSDYVQAAADSGECDAAFLEALYRKTEDYAAIPPIPITPPMLDTPDVPPVITAPLVKNAGGAEISLGTLLGRGGEGTVYDVPSLPDKVAKIYSDKIRSGERALQLERKIRLLCRKGAAYLDDVPVAAIPEEPLYFPDGSFAGYLMPQMETSTKIFDVQRSSWWRERLFPDLNYQDLIAIAYNLAEVVDHLHRSDIIIGDMNQSNILIHKDGTVTLIDCDSFDITDPDTGEHFPCVVGIEELLAPELQSLKSLKNGGFTRESDNFSLAIHIFRLLMNNQNPFGFVATTDISYGVNPSNAEIINGECLYVRNIPGKKIPPAAPTLDILPEEIQSLFRRVFDYTAETAGDAISRRPTASEWMQALQHFYQMPLQKCFNNPFHRYLSSLSGCPFCKDTDRFNFPPVIQVEI